MPDFFFFLANLWSLHQAMSSPEDKAYEIMRELDVNYVLVIFGGLTGYASDGTCRQCIKESYQHCIYCRH